MTIKQTVYQLPNAAVDITCRIFTTGVFIIRFYEIIKTANQFGSLQYDELRDK
jgi:hypothetical protein